MVLVVLVGMGLNMDSLLTTMESRPITELELADSGDNSKADPTMIDMWVWAISYCSALNNYFLLLYNALHLEILVYYWKHFAFLRLCRVISVNTYQCITSI